MTTGGSEGQGGPEPDPDFSRVIRDHLASYANEELFPRIETLLANHRQQITSDLQDIQRNMPNDSHIGRIVEGVVANMAQTPRGAAGPQAAPTTADEIEDAQAAAGETPGDGAATKVAGKMSAMSQGVVDELMKSPVETLLAGLKYWDERTERKAMIDMGFSNPFYLFKMLGEKNPEVAQYFASTQWAQDPMEELIPGMMGKVGGDSFSSGFKAGAAAMRAAGGSVEAPHPFAPGKPRSEEPPAPAPAPDVPPSSEAAPSPVASSEGSEQEHAPRDTVFARLAGKP